MNLPYHCKIIKYNELVNEANMMQTGKLVVVYQMTKGILNKIDNTQREIIHLNTGIKKKLRTR